MERKIVKQGRNALTITLPAQWTAQKGLKAGDTIDITQENNVLIVRSKLTRQKKEITLDLSEAEKPLMFHMILGAYIEGYDTITILHGNALQTKEVASHLIGMIIEEHTKKRIVIKNIIETPEKNIEIIMRRIGHMFSEHAKIVCECVEQKATQEEVKAHEALLDDHLAYCLRYINKYEKNEEAYKYFLLLATLESASDTLSAIALHSQKNKKQSNKKEQALIQDLTKTIEVYVHGLFEGDVKKVYHILRAQRKEIEKKTFIDGLVFSLIESLYNYIGFLINQKGSKNKEAT